MALACCHRGVAGVLLEGSGGLAPTNVDESVLMWKEGITLTNRGEAPPRSGCLWCTEEKFSPEML